MRQPARNHYRKTVIPKQRRNRWLLYATLTLLAICGNRWVASCTCPKPPQPERQRVLVAS